MATLQKLRSNAAGLLIGAMGLALLAFILTDLFTSGNTLFNKFKDKAFTVNGETVSTSDYQERVTEWENFQKFISGNNSLGDNATTQIRERVYQEMVKEIILDQEAKKLGLSVSKEEMNDMVYGQNISPVLTQLPMFMDPNSHQFSREALANFMKFITANDAGMNEQQKAYAQMYKTYWVFIERMMKYQRLEEKYNALLASTVMVNNVETQQSFDDSKYTADISYVLERYSSIPDNSVKVSDDEIKKLYDERKSSFKSNMEMAKVSYFVKDVVPSQEDYALADKSINEAHDKLASATNVGNVVGEYSEVPYQDVYISVNSLSGDAKTFAQTAAIGEIKGPIKSASSYSVMKLIDKTVGPDSVNVSSIAIPATKADSIMNAVKGGKDFDEVAKSLGQNQGSQWVTEPMLANAGKDVVSACFNTPVGQIAKVEKNGQAQLIKVNERTASVSKVKLALIQIPVIPSDKTQNNVDNELNSFVSEFGKSDKFIKGAQSKGYNLIPDAMVTTSDISLGQVQGTSQVVNWAFKGKEGEVKKFDFSDKRVIAMIVKQIKPGYIPLDVVSPMLKAELIKDKKAEKMIADIKAKNPKTLDDYVKAMSSKVDTVKFVNFAANSISGLGQEYALNIYSAIGKVNEVSGPVKGSNGVFAIQVTNRASLPMKYNPQQMARSLSQNAVYRITYQAMDVLKQKLKVKDNRYQFF